MRITKVSKKLIEHLKEFESFSATPYLCPAGYFTIGYGSTYYPDGRKVTKYDGSITEAQALDMLMQFMVQYEKGVDSITRDDITQGQFDALVDFAFNAGTQNLKTSTLLKKVNANPSDPTIGTEFMKWVYGGDGTKNKKDDDGDGKVDEAGEKQRLNGLIRRRTAEAQMYFS